MQENYTPNPGVVPSAEELDKFLNLPDGDSFESIEFGVLSNYFDGSKFIYRKSKVINRGNLHENAIKNIKPFLIKQISNLIAECFSKLKTSNDTKNDYNETLYIRVEVPGQLDKLIVCKHPMLAEAKLVSNEKEIVSSDTVKFITEEISNFQSAMFEMYIVHLENLTKKLLDDSPEIDFVVFSRFLDTVYLYSIEYEFPNGAAKLKKEGYKIANGIANETFMSFLALSYNLFWFRNGKMAYGQIDDIVFQLSQNYNKYIDTKCLSTRKVLIETIISAETAYFQIRNEEPK